MIFSPTLSLNQPSVFPLWLSVFWLVILFPSSPCKGLSPFPRQAPWRGPAYPADSGIFIVYLKFQLHPVILQPGFVFLVIWNYTRNNTRKLLCVAFFNLLSKSEVWPMYNFPEDSL
jgi:hypothetical protein